MSEFNFRKKFKKNPSEEVSSTTSSTNSTPSSAPSTTTSTGSRFNRGSSVTDTRSNQSENSLITIGSVTFGTFMDDDVIDEAAGIVRENEAGLMLYTYVGKDSKPVELKNKDTIRIAVEPSKGKTPDWVVGNFYVNTPSGEKRVGNFSLTKKTKNPAEVIDLLKEVSGLKVQVYLPEEAEALELSNKTRLIVSFKLGKNNKAPKFVVGRAYLPTA